MLTFKCTYADNSKATVKEVDAKTARKRFEQMGRGVRIRNIEIVSSAAHQVFGKDEDDDYEEGE